MQSKLVESGFLW